MLHPDYRLVRNHAAVRTAAAAYRDAWRQHDGSAEAGRACAVAEAVLNREVEAAIAPKGR
jgi:hypothetical protein